MPSKTKNECGLTHLGLCKMYMFKKMVEDNPQKYPENMGKTWSVVEQQQLMASIQMNKTIDDIAQEHKRTSGGIRSRIRHLAAEFWFNEHKNVEEIRNLTRLSYEQIEDVIQKRTAKKTPKDTFNKSEILWELKTIRDRVDVLISRIHSQETNRAQIEVRM